MLAITPGTKLSIESSATYCLKNKIVISAPNIPANTDFSELRNPKIAKIKGMLTTGKYNPANETTSSKTLSTFIAKSTAIIPVATAVILAVKSSFLAQDSPKGLQKSCANSIDIELIAESALDIIIAIIPTPIIPLNP